MGSLPMLGNTMSSSEYSTSLAWVWDHLDAFVWCHCRAICSMFVPVAMMAAAFVTFFEMFGSWPAARVRFAASRRARASARPTAGYGPRDKVRSLPA